MSKNLPTVTSNIPRDLRNFLDRLRDIVNGSGANKLISSQDLVDAGLATLSKSGTLATTTPAGFIYGTPPAPTNLEASAAITNVILTWDEPDYPGHAYAEVWASSTDNIGAAVLLGLTPGSVYTDPLGPGSARYYWVRFVNTQNVIGPFNAVAGTLAETGEDVDYLLDVLAGQITESELFTDLNTRLNKIETTESKYTVKIDNGGHISGFGLISTANDASPYAAFGIRANQFFMAPPATVQSTAPVTGLYKGYVWVDSSVNPYVTKYYTGTTWSTSPQALPFVVQATPTSEGSVSIPAGVYMDAAFIKNASISNAKIADLAVDSAKIAYAAIDTARIANLAVDAAKIQDLAVGTLKIQDEAVSVVSRANKTYTNNTDEKWRFPFDMPAAGDFIVVLVVIPQGVASTTSICRIEITSNTLPGPPDTPLADYIDTSGYVAAGIKTITLKGTRAAGSGYWIDVRFILTNFAYNSSGERGARLDFLLLRRFK